MKQAAMTIVAVVVVVAVAPGVGSAQTQAATEKAADTKQSADSKEVDERIEMLADLVKHDGDFRVRVQAVFSLAKIQNPKVVPILIMALADKHPTVRAAAATALGKIGAEDAVPALEKALEDPVQTVKEAAKEALKLVLSDPKKLALLFETPDVVCDVPFHQVTTLIVLGPLKNKSGSARDDLEAVFRRLMVENLLEAKIPDSMIVSKGEVPAVVDERLKNGKAKGFFLTGTLLKLDKAWEKQERYVVSASVSLACMYYPDQNLAMTMQASAEASVVKASYNKAIVPKLEEDAIGGTLSSVIGSFKGGMEKLAAKDKKPGGKKPKDKKPKSKKPA